MAYKDLVVPVHLAAVSPDSCQPGLPSFLGHVKLIPDAWSLHSLSLCPGMNGASPDVQIGGLFCLSIVISKKNLLTEVFPDLSKARPSLHCNLIILLSCNFLKCSCFLVYCLSSSTVHFMEVSLFA